MDALMYLQEKSRMLKSNKDQACNIHCDECPLCSGNNGTDMNCTTFEIVHPEWAIAIVEKWSKEHSQKTYLQYFREVFPKMESKSDEFIAYNYCAKLYFADGLMPDDDCRNNRCMECWSDIIEK